MKCNGDRLNYRLCKKKAGKLVVQIVLLLCVNMMLFYWKNIF